MLPHPTSIHAAADLRRIDLLENAAHERLLRSASAGHGRSQWAERVPIVLALAVVLVIIAMSRVASPALGA